MRITELRGFHLSFALPEPVGNCLGFFDRRTVLVVRVSTDTGHVGWGETSAPHSSAAAFIRSHLWPILKGQEAERIGVLWHRMCQVRGYDRQGTAMMAISAIDMALHDAVARSQGISVASLIGGAHRDRVLAYASGPFMKPGPDPYRDFQSDVEDLLRRNFRAIKPRAGASPRADGAMTDRLRWQVGPEVALMVDFNQGYSPAAAIESARRMEPADLLWIEEPTIPEDFAGYRSIAQAVPTPISGGEAIVSLAGFREFLQTSSVSLLQPDLTICGGFTGMSRVSALAEAFNVPLTPHTFGTAVNFCASLQLAVTLPAQRGGGPAPFPFIEYDSTFNPLLNRFGDWEPGADGCLALPDKPGIGLDLAPEDLEEFIVGQWSERL